MTQKLSFLETIYRLRTIEQIVLFNKVLKISKAEEKDALDFLRDEYEKEKMNYPFTAPDFDEKASIWASKIVYFSAQLFLTRNDTNKDLKILLPNYTGKINAGAVLSSDLCLRFLPIILEELKKVDPDDPIISILEKHLTDFQYSNIGFKHQEEKFTLNLALLENKCYKQLFLDRVTQKKDTFIASINQINSALMANFGNYKESFWKELEIVESRKSKVGEQSPMLKAKSQEKRII